MLFNLTVSHANGSLYDARNLTVTDSTQGMDFYDSDVSTKGVFVTSPKKNTFVLRFILASLLGKLELSVWALFISRELLSTCWVLEMVIFDHPPLPKVVEMVGV